MLFLPGHPLLNKELLSIHYVQATALRHLRWFALFNLHIMRPTLSLFTNGEPGVSKFTHLAQVHPAAKFKSWIGTWL